MTRPIRIVQLYPRDMNIYGDRGNVLTLERRLQWRGIDYELVEHHPGDSARLDADIMIGGGGQDSGQVRIVSDLRLISDQIRESVARDVPMLMVCGMYQLFGSSIRTLDGQHLEGVGVFAMDTTFESKRLVGNTVVDTEDFGQLVGYENHSGRTRLHPGQRPLGVVTQGAGNNGGDRNEGARTRNAIGTYLHGPVLPKNPAIADFLIATALRNAGMATELRPLDDTLARLSREAARSRPR